MSAHYFDTEREGQILFFENLMIPWKDCPVLVDNTDGVYRGVLFEFKKEISDLNRVVFQAVKYLSKMRIRGESVPAHFLLVSLNTAVAYAYDSQDYFDEIHKVYYGGASKDNSGFISRKYRDVFNYSESSDMIRLMDFLRVEEFMPVAIDENCIVGWAERYYRENPSASKGDFLGDSHGQITTVGEIRRPVYFRGLILPYAGKSNERFKYLMDKLNDRLNRKELGAFYTPPAYCRLAAELVRDAVSRVPVGNDYVVIDRCAGTGNLESVLPDEILSHCILSTYEYYEYKVLFERLHDRVRFIIPPTEEHVVYRSGFVDNANALSKDYIEMPEIGRYVNDPKCTVILLENPPYRDDVADNGQIRRSFVFNEFSKVLNEFPNPNISTARDILNQFVWSAWKFYLRKPEDSYILFCPLKCWKTLGLLNRRAGRGFLFNRKHFHASASSVSCVHWFNQPDSSTSLGLELFDLDQFGKPIFVSKQVFQKANQTLEPFFDRRREDEKNVCNLYCESNGTLTSGRKCDGKSYLSDELIAYLRTDSFGIDPKHVSLTRLTLYNIRGFYVRKDNMLKVLPLYAAKRFPQDIWYEKDVYVSSADGGNAYCQDSIFLKRCFIFACLHGQNKCRSLIIDRNGKQEILRNELCFDSGTYASSVLVSMKLDDEEKELLLLYKKILGLCRDTANYNPLFSYGPFQIAEELNTMHETENGMLPDYVELNGDLIVLRERVKEYYNHNIRQSLFAYQLLK